jgi:hypothetical protein
VAWHILNPNLPQAEQESIEKVYRINLKTGKADTLLRNIYGGSYGISRILPLDDQSKIIFVYGDRLNGGDVRIANLDNLEIQDSIFSDPGLIDNILDAPKMNRIYFRFVNMSADSAYTYVFDRTTFTLLGSADENVWGNLFSRDHKYRYSFINGQGEGLFFDVFNLITNREELRKRCGTIGNIKYGPSFWSGVNGYAVVGFKQIAGFENQKYAICDVDAGSVLNIISFPKRSEPELSADGKRVIIEEIPWDDGPKRSGRYWIYETETGELLQRLFLPPNGDLLTFENYPDMIYYYLENENRSMNFNLNTLSTISSLSPMAIYASSNAFTLTVNGKNFVNGSTVNLNGAARTTTVISDSTLQASILASDVAVIDSPLVTVKSADGSAESNGIRFYVVRQRTILEMIDSLRIKLQQCLSQGQIGDKNFVNELDNGLENARKHLIKGDSTNCRKEIAKFQDKVKKEYEKKSNNKRFVTEEGYRILNNSAQAILNRLPGKK